MNSIYRQEAIDWFFNKDVYNKSELSHKYFKDTVSYNFDCLTGREIEIIWRREVMSNNIQDSIDVDDWSK